MLQGRGDNMSELKACAEIMKRIRELTPETFSQEEANELARQVGMVSCQGCRANFIKTMEKLGADMKAIDSAIKEGLNSSERASVVKQKMADDIRRAIKNNKPRK